MTDATTNQPTTIIDRAADPGDVRPNAEADLVAMTDPTGMSADAAAPRLQQESKWTRVSRAFRTAPATAWFGMIVIALYITAAVFANVIAPYGEREILGEQFLPPGSVAYKLDDANATEGVRERFGDMMESLTAELPDKVGDELFYVVDDLKVPEVITFLNDRSGDAENGFDPAYVDTVSARLSDFAAAEGYESDRFILGTDNIGRDTFSRLIYAARNTVGIALITTFLSFLLGGFLGMLAATLGGWVDQVLSRVVDVLMSIPSLIFALLALTVANAWIGRMDNPSPLIYTAALIVIIAVLDSTRVFRLTRAVAMNIVVMDYVEAARLRGEGLLYIVRKEILPNATAPLIAEFGLRFCFVFLTISALSFLGLGIQPPTADWGSMVQENKALISFGVAVPLYPAAAIALLTVAVNFVVDWMLHRSSGLKE